MTRNEMENIFKNHWEYYSKQGAGILDTINNLQVKIAQAYSGRVIYELLQNAFDPASNDTHPNIFLNLIDDEDKFKYLVVANNGTEFSYIEKFDYNKKEPKNNFNSLCSISDSSKKFSQSIGNKGIGFRSVFQVNESIAQKLAYIFTKRNQEDEYFKFKLYETVQIEEIESSDFYSNEIKNNLETNGQVGLLEKNRISGYCYPTLLQDEEIAESLKIQISNLKDYKTIIVVPVEKKNEKIEQYIGQIKKIHFSFVSLKYKKAINISIGKDSQKSTVKTKQLSHAKLKQDDNLKKIAKDLKLFSDDEDFNVQVGCYYHQSDEVNYIYNYLPTEMKSPFRRMDIHSDFLTSLNRESMNLKEAEDEGKYNLALLQACIELHFLTLSNYLKNSDIELNLEFIDKNNSSEVEFDRDDFWKYLQLNDSITKQRTVGIIKKIFNDDWNNFGKFISLLAKEYFNQENLKKDNFDNFWKVIKQYTEINSYVNIWTVGFKEKIRDLFLTNLLNHKVKCVYIHERSVTTLGNHLYFKDKDEENLDLSFLNVKLTSYNFYELSGGFLTDTSINKEQRFIHKYSDINEILKHFRQIQKNAILSDEKIEEAIQKNIINTIFQIYLSKKESNFLSTHRYEELLSNKSNKDYTKIAANFAISTIFLKIKDQKLYKPAQYCHYSELDIEFLELQIPNDKKDIKSIEDFFKFLGVSFDKNIKYIDKLSDKSEFFKGLDYIPFLIRDTDIQEESSKTPYIPNMRIQYKDSSGKEICKHPALFYKTSTYNVILNEIKSKDTEKESLNLVVKNLEDYPEKYIDELVNKEFDMKDIDEAVVFKFYNEIFKKYSKKYLIYKYDRTFEWLEENKLDKTNKSFLIAKTKEDFDLLKNKTNILATFSDVSDNDNLKVLQARIEKSIVNMDGEDKKFIKQQLDILVPYILLSISKSDKESRKDFLEDGQSNLLYYFQKWQELEFKQLEKIELKIKIVGKEEEITPTELSEPILIDKIVYYIEKNELYEFANIMADFFTVGKLQTNIENILLKGEKVRNSFDKREIEQISSKWININDKTKENIIKELKTIGFRDDIRFKLRYFKSDLREGDDRFINETQNGVQKKIDQIEKPENVKIIFDCEDKNITLIKEIIDKYSLIELSIDNIQKAQLIQKVYLERKDIFSIFGKTEEQLDEELERLTRENLKEDYKLEMPPKESSAEIGQKEDKTETTTNVDNFSKNHHSVRNIKIAQNRGLRIEEELVKELAKDLKFTDWQASIKEIFEEIKNQKLVDGTTPRYNLKNQDKYEKLLKDENTKLSDLLHMSKILGDGLGFDILYPKIEDNGNINLLKVEVKSSFDGKNIYLSENERKQILLSKDDENFKIYLYIREKEPLDITEIVRNVLLENNKFSNITAETWIINL